MKHDHDFLFGIADFLDDDEGNGAFIDPVTGQVRLEDLSFLFENGHQVQPRLPLEDAHAD